jgi:hypothetical protein
LLKDLKTLYIVVDAFRSDYINDTTMPHMSKLANKSKYIKEVVPSPGFCERVEILTGKKNEETGYFTAIDLVDSGHKFSLFLKFISIFSGLLKFFERLLNSYFIFRVRKKINQIFISKIFPDKNMPIFNIPLNLYEKFDLSEDLVDQSLPSAFGVPSIVDRSIEQGKSINFDAFTSLGDNNSLYNDELRLSYLTQNFFKSKDSIFFLYLGELDAMGHKYGPSSSEFNKILHSFDNKLNTFLTSLNNQGDFNLAIIGDHGMSDVKNCVDFEKEINRSLSSIDLSLNDVIIFCDSTVGRVWSKDGQVLDGLKNTLLDNNILNKYGVIFDESDYGKYEVPINLKKHGEIIWFANDGVVISPDYFYGLFPPKGMHGYLPIHKQNFGLGIFSAPNIIPEVFGRKNLCELMDMSYSYFK